MGRAMTMMMLSNRRNNEGENRSRNEYPSDIYNRQNERSNANNGDNYNRNYNGNYNDNYNGMENRRVYPMRNEYEQAESRRRMEDDEDMPEMRRRRDKRGRYMENDTEMRAGLYDGGNAGFGNRYDQPRNALEHGKRQQVTAGGTFWMNPGDDEEDKLDKEKMHKWVKKMEDSKGEPIKPWGEDEIKPLARRFGYPTSGEEFDSFYTAIHAMKSDYCDVAKEFDVDTPAFYAAMADAFLSDPDAKLQDKEKLEAYYKYIVMGRK